MVCSFNPPRLLLLLILILLVTASDLVAQMPAGNEFVIAVPALWRRSELIDPGDIRIMVMATRRTEVRLRWSDSDGALLDRVTVQAGGRGMFATPMLFQTPNIMQENFDRVPVEVNQRSFVVESDEPISLFVLYDHYAESEFNGRSKTEMWSVPPTSSYDTSFVLLTEPGTSQWGDRTGFLIIATEDGTTIDWEPSVRWGYVAPIDPVPGTISMNRHQVYQVLSWDRGGPEADLSGTKITSNRPIAILPFSLGSDIGPSIEGRKSTVAEHQYSRNQAGTLFYSIPFAPQSESRVRLVAQEDSTLIWYNDELVDTVLNSGEIHQGVTGKYETSRPVVAMQLLRRERTSGPGNPAMALLPPVRNYAGRLQWINPHLEERPPESGNYWRHYVMITAPRSAAESVLLDGQPVTFTHLHVDSQYVSTVVPLNPKGYVLTAESPVSAIAYGMAIDDSYAYLAGEGVRSIIATDVDTLELITCDTIGDLALKLRSDGNLAYRIDSIRADGVELTAIRYPPSFPTRMPPGREIEVLLRFALPTARTYTGTIRIYSDALNESVTTIPFRIIRDSARLAIPRTIDLGQIDGATTTVDTAIRIVNEGDDTVTVNTLFSSNPRFEIVEPATPLLLLPGQADTILLRVTPQPGILETAQIDILGEPCFVPISVKVTAFRGAGPLLGIPTLVDFPGTLCDAEPGGDTAILIRAIGDEPLEIKEIRLAGDDAAMFTILSDPAPVTILPGDSAIVRIGYGPTTFGLHRARLELESNGVNVTPPAKVELAGRRDTAMVSPDQRDIALPVLLSCNSAGTLELRLRNDGSVAAEISSVEFRSGTAFTINGALPASLAARGGERIVEIRFTPPSDGDFVDTLVIRGEPCGIEERVVVRGSRRTPTLDASTEEIDFPTLYLCDRTEAEQWFRLSNGGEVIDTLHALVQSGDGAFELTDRNGNPLTFPIILPPGEGIDLRLEFRPPAGGTFNGALSFDWGPCDGNLRISFSGSAQLPEVSLSTDRIDFGPLRVDGETVRQSVTIINRSVLPREIISLDFGAAASELRLVSPASLPVTIPAGGELTIEVEFDPDRIGSLAEFATLAIASPCPQELRIGVTGEGTAEEISRADLLLDVPHGLYGRPGEEVEIPVRITDGENLEEVAITDVELWLDWNASLIFPRSLATTLPGWTGEIVENRIDGDRRRLRIRFSGEGGIRVGDELGRVTGLILLGDRDTTDIMINLIDLITPPPSLVTFRLDPGRFTATGICRNDGDRLIGSIGPLKLGLPRPNPAAESITIPAALERSGSLRIRLYDPLGVEQPGGFAREMEKGEQMLTLSVSTLPPGLYLCRIEFEGTVLQRTILIQR